jgi:peptidoglycan/LPS O-acetylase OafA/YrhL
MVNLAHYWPLFYPLACGISYACCMIAVLYGSASLKRPFEWPLLRWIGFISFSLYMWHQPFIVYFLGNVGTNITSAGFSLIVKYCASYVWVLVIVFPVALASYRWIEMPGMRLGEYIIRRMDKKGSQRKSKEAQEDGSLDLQLVGEK